MDRVLLATMTIEKIIVVREKCGTRGQLEDPRAQRFGQSQFRSDRPAMSADVEQAVGIVLSQRSRDLQARTQDQILTIAAKLLRRKRRRAVEVDRIADSGITDAG